MSFWYTINCPRNRPCWEINPVLWNCFCQAMIEKYGVAPSQNQLYTEQYVVQRMDMEAAKEEMDGDES